MAHVNEIVSVISGKLDRIAARLEHVGGSHSTSGVHIHGGGWLAILGIAALGLAGHEMSIDRVRREAELRVFAAERRTDLAELSTVRSNAIYARDQAAVAKTMAQQYRMEFTERLAKLEATK